VKNGAMEYWSIVKSRYAHYGVFDQNAHNLRDSYPVSSPSRDCVATTKNPMVVMLSAAKHLAFSVTYEDEILRLLPQDDIPEGY